MTIRQTHTFAELELSKAAYDEIATKLRAAGYDHAFIDDGIIDMHGIGVTVEEGSELLRCTLTGFIIASYFAASFEGTEPAK